MIAYIDSSILLRVLLQQPDCLLFPGEVTHFFSSKLLELECMRVLDRHRLIEHWDEDELSGYYEKLHAALSSIELVRIGNAIISRACSPFPSAIGTLDAIHLSTLLLWQGNNESKVMLLTHDDQLGKAARVLGIPVLGV